MKVTFNSAIQFGGRLNLCNWWGGKDKDICYLYLGTDHWLDTEEYRTENSRVGRTDDESIHRKG